jgi:hypothetical protein
VTQVHVYRAIEGGICLALSDRIATPSGSIPVIELRPGTIVWTLDATGRRVLAPVLILTHTAIPAGHHMLRVVFSDGRAVDASAGHPTVDGRHIGDLRPGDWLDGSRIDAVQAIPYAGDTWDLLPDGPTGAYWANDVLLGSTLALVGSAP